MLSVLGGLAEFESDLILPGRVKAGREPSPRDKMGRPPKLTPHQQREAIRRRDRGEELLTDIGCSYNVSAATISRLAAARAWCLPDRRADGAGRASSATRLTYSVFRLAACAPTKPGDVQSWDLCH